MTHASLIGSGACELWKSHKAILNFNTANCNGKSLARRVALSAYRDRGSLVHLHTLLHLHRASVRANVESDSEGRGGGMAAVKTEKKVVVKTGEFRRWHVMACDGGRTPSSCVVD
jgi:hypothetical protein